MWAPHAEGGQGRPCRGNWRPGCVLGRALNGTGRRSAGPGQAPLGGVHETQEQAGSLFSLHTSELHEFLAKGICVPSVT